jgi:RimJ/RimL family protein N-acetyltransferase
MLRALQQEDYKLIGQWASNPFELFRFAADTWQFPVTEASVTEYISKNKSRYQFIFEQNGISAGFCELILKDTDTPRLSRIILGSAFRGRGWGKVMINEMLDKCRELSSLKKVYLYVIESNEAARKCYESCGFVYENEEKLVLHFESQHYPILKMSCIL